MNVLRATVLVLAVQLAGGPVLADQRDARLPALFAELRAAPDIGPARAIETQIWGLWHEHDDHAVVLLMGQGRAAMARQDHRSALRSFDQVVKIAPDFAEGWNARATLYYLIGRHADSLADIDKTLALEPGASAEVVFETAGSTSVSLGDARFLSNDPDEKRARLPLRVGANAVFEGDPALDFSYTALNLGTTHTLSEQRGKVVLLAYWATF